MNHRGQRGRFAATAAFAGGLILVASCGARTGLPVPADKLLDTQDASDAAPVACTPGSFTLAKALPTVMFVIDRSGSMSTRFSTAGSRWSVLTSGLAKALPSVDGTMQIGALLFPSVSAGRGDLSCAVPGAADLLPKTGNVKPLLYAMEAHGPGGATPTAAALDVANAALLSVRSSRSARAMVLATDGGPNCNGALNPQTCTCADLGSGCRRNASQCLDDARTVARIASYASKGVPTYVIGIGNDAASVTLDAMANAGGRPQSGAHAYYAATSEPELDAALVTIRDAVGACTYLTPSVPDAQGRISLSIDGKPVPFDAANGGAWSDQTNGEIVLSGAACKLVTSAALNVVATVSCGEPDAAGDAPADGPVDGALDAAADGDAASDAADAD